VRLVEVLVLAGERDDGCPEVLGLEMLVDAISNIIGFAYVELVL
jgi:hypothetical protein